MIYPPFTLHIRPDLGVLHDSLCVCLDPAPPTSARRGNRDAPIGYGRSQYPPWTQAAWFRRATTIRLYRERYSITGPAPLGNPDQVKGLEQAYEYRAARAAYDRIRYLIDRQPTHSISRSEPSMGHDRSIGF